MGSRWAQEGDGLAEQWSTLYIKREGAGVLHGSWVDSRGRRCHSQGLLHDRVHCLTCLHHCVPCPVSVQLPFALMSTQYRRKRYMDNLLSGTKEGFSAMVRAAEQYQQESNKAPSQSGEKGR